MSTVDSQGSTQGDETPKQAAEPAESAESAAEAAEEAAEPADAAEEPAEEATAVNPTSASLLGYLYWQPMSGGEIVAAVEASIGHFWNITRSQIYRELKSLAAADLVKLGELGPRRRAPYAITDRGREAFLAWLAIDPGPDAMRSPFLLKFFFAALLPEETLRRFVGLVRPRHEQTLAYFHDLLPKIVRTDPAPAHVVRLAITYEQGILDWLDSIPWGKLKAEDLDPAGPEPVVDPEPGPETEPDST